MPTEGRTIVTRSRGGSNRRARAEPSIDSLPPGCHVQAEEGIDQGSQEVAGDGLEKDWRSRLLTEFQRRTPQVWVLDRHRAIAARACTFGVHEQIPGFSSRLGVHHPR